MEHQQDPSNTFDTLRQRAEALLQERPDDSGNKPSDILDLIHELEVHQAEIKIQNEELKQAQQELSESRREFENLYEFAPCGYLTLNAKGVVTRANLTATTILETQRRSLVGSRLQPYLYITLAWDDIYQRAQQAALNTREKQSIEIPLRKKGGLPKWVRADIEADVDETGSLMQWRIVLMDISAQRQAEEDKRKLEEHLRQSQKMESIGVLAGGIAHDFNNILYPLVGFTELLKEDIPADSPLHNHVDEILQASFRARDLVKQILAFSRQEKQELKPIKLQSIIKEVLKLLRSSIPTSIGIQQDIDPGCGLVVADPSQVHQIIMNLATNANDAMSNNGGILTVTLKQVKFEREHVHSMNLVPGNYARLCVSDTGSGIEKNQLDKIFDPYFTTKETGRGTGLGLAVVQGIVRQSHGDIHIESEPGKGTEVKVYLPIKAKIAEDIEEIQIDQDKPVQGGIEKILLVDDEAPIVKMEEQMLDRLGYTVTIRTGSLDALEAFKADPQGFDVVVTDMTMPNMTGVQLAAELKKIRPNIPVVLCTGFSYQVNDEKSKALGIDGFVMKPVIMTEIATTIRKVLDNTKV